MKKPNEYLAVVVLSEAEKNRIRELYDLYNTNISLTDCFVDLLNNQICKNDVFNAYALRVLIREATSNENTEHLRNVFLCIAKNLHWCTKEELKKANITI